MPIGSAESNDTTTCIKSGIFSEHIGIHKNQCFSCRLVKPISLTHDQYPNTMKQ